MKKSSKILMALFAAATIFLGFVSCSDDAEDVNVTNADTSYSYVYERSGKSGSRVPVIVEWTKKANSNYAQFSIPGAGEFYKDARGWHDLNWNDEPSGSGSVSYNQCFTGTPGDKTFTYENGSTYYSYYKRR